MTKIVTKIVQFNGVSLRVPGVYTSIDEYEDLDVTSCHKDGEKLVALLVTMSKLDLLQNAGMVIRKSMFDSRQEYVIRVWQ